MRPTCACAAHPEQKQIALPFPNFCPFTLVQDSVVVITEDVQNVHLLLEYRPHIDVSLTCEHDPKLQEYCVCPQNMPQFDSEGIPNQAPETNKPMILNGPTSRNELSECPLNVSFDGNDLRKEKRSVLYIKQRVKVKIGEELSEGIEIEKAVRLQQGCPLSLTLFNIYFEGLVKNCFQNMRGVIVGGRRIKCIRFADDMVLLAEEEMILRKHAARAK
ncbi:hypothetical protein ANN_12322 [Periplaneta americana]|uniref:Reverse transcriptase domain-containing protein n=1 Tax=Periplaneta americana TaxID=6978 RepID=A0ABQ8TIE4_PERAM|nr:hypothetical protein ANN_12322 [Periplaneta americana]